jgi:hypothetical protein
VSNAHVRLLLHTTHSGTRLAGVDEATKLSPISSACAGTALQHQQQSHCFRKYHHMLPVTPNAAASKGYCTLLLFETLDSVLQQLVAHNVSTRALLLSFSHLN